MAWHLLVGSEADQRASTTESLVKSLDISADIREVGYIGFAHYTAHALYALRCCSAAALIRYIFLYPDHATSTRFMAV